MTLPQNDTADAQEAAARRALLIARALLDPRRVARFDEGRDPCETEARLFAEIEGRAYLLAFSLRVERLRDLGGPFSEELRRRARSILGAEGAPPGPAESAGPAPLSPREAPSAPGPAPAPVNAIRALRKRLRLSQEAFSRRYGIPVGTVRDWEQGRSAPDACGRAYLAVIARAPEIVPGAAGEACRAKGPQL